jgi:hypothetical protein
MFKVMLKEMLKGRTVKNRTVFESPDRIVAVSRMSPIFKEAIKAWDEKYALETGYDDKEHAFWAIPIDHDKCLKVYLAEA